MQNNKKELHKEATKKAKLIAMRSFLTVLGVFFGVLISAQMNSIPERVTNPIAPYASLKETKESLYQEQLELKAEIKNLQESIQKIQKDSENIALTKGELEDLKNEKAKAGLTKINGPGVIITLDDSKASVVSEDSIVHAADLRDIINLLWGSGAEAISINGQRIVVNTAIDCIVNTILVNDTRISTPFNIEAIGDQSQMYNNLISPLLLTNIHERSKNQGLIFNLTKNNDITVPIFDGSFEVKTEKVVS